METKFIYNYLAHGENPIISYGQSNARVIARMFTSPDVYGMHVRGIFYARKLDGSWMITNHDHRYPMEVNIK